MSCIPRPDVSCVSCDLARRKVEGEAVLVRALPRARFACPCGKDLVLPVGAADALERLEQGFRSAGLIGLDQRLVQRLGFADKYRVETVYLRMHRRVPRSLTTLDLVLQSQKRQAAGDQPAPVIAEGDLGRAAATPATVRPQHPVAWLRIPRRAAGAPTRILMRK